MSARIRTRKRRRPTGGRAGFTLVELLVALMVFAVGMLGLAATAGSVTRMMGGAKRQTLAATVAQSRLEKIRSSPCASLVSGSETVRGITNTWTITAVTRGIDVRDSVSFPGSGNTRRWKVYRTSLSC
ncbi:MAG TPA: prepilin-type N-terminal cleavage/methylation domain-containing protein [Gemmatimonadaceae bacterium]|nr:prepilin-type N-terminal cleavage/methylation domain-containing protein [Gemmatimonadaceae bacterium]